MLTLLFRGEAKTVCQVCSKLRHILVLPWANPASLLAFLGAVKMSEAPVTSEVCSVPGSRTELQVLNFKKLLKENMKLQEVAALPHCAKTQGMLCLDLIHALYKWPSILFPWKEICPCVFWFLPLTWIS